MRAVLVSPEHVEGLSDLLTDALEVEEDFAWAVLLVVLSAAMEGLLPPTVEGRVMAGLAEAGGRMGLLLASWLPVGP